MIAQIDLPDPPQKPRENKNRSLIGAVFGSLFAARCLALLCCLLFLSSLLLLCHSNINFFVVASIDLALLMNVILINRTYHFDAM